MNESTAKPGEKMHKSEHRLLTTHAGSLPRPAELTRLYARRSRGEAVPAAELEAEGKAALRRVVAKQVEAGIDIGNNGEQQRDSFLFYIRDRLSGLGGSWQRRQRADVERYPIFMKESYEAVAEKEVGRRHPRPDPERVGDIGYPDAGRGEGRVRRFPPRSMRAATRSSSRS